MLALEAGAVASEGTSTDIERVFALQRGTALRLRTSTPAERIAKLKRLRAVLMQHRQAIIEAGAKDFRRPALEVEFTELMPVIADISDYCSRLKTLLRPRRVRPTNLMIGTTAWIRYEPRGRCLLISPWNYPVTLTLGPLVAAIASGNAVIIKTSEITPNFSTVLASIVRSAFPEDEVALFEGDASVATALLNLPFDHIFFTGAPTIGKVVMQAASRHLASVTLELGGKSPTIVDPTADLELAVKTIAWNKCTNSGQTCIAPDHVYVHASIKDRFVELYRAYLGKHYGEGQAVKQSELTRVVNERHTRRIANLLDDARGRGAEVLVGGIVEPGEHFVSPTLLTAIPPDAQIMREEIFGPLLPILPYEHIEDVIASINDAPKPLALYIWSRDQRTIDTLIERTSSGGACINHVAMHFMHHNLPFGGVNNSGIGSYHGEWGIRAFSHERAVLRTHVMLAKLFFPPHTAWTRRIVDWILRYL